MTPDLVPESARTACPRGPGREIDEVEPARSHGDALQTVREVRAELSGLNRSQDEDLDRLAERLLRRFRVHDDVEAFTLLVEVLQDRLTQIATVLVRRLGVVVDPDDLVASFMARLFTDVRRDQPVVRHFLGMAYTAMRFDALNQLRRHQRARRRGELWEEMTSSWRVPPDPAVEVEGREHLADVRRLRTLVLTVVIRCYDGLRPRERRILQLREIEHLAYDRIAREMDLPKNQVGMILKRARDRLATAITDTLNHLGGASNRRHPFQGRA